MTPERMRAVLNAAAGQLWQLLPKRDAKEEQVAWGVVAAASGCVLMAATTVLTLVKCVPWGGGAGCRVNGLP